MTDFRWGVFIALTVSDLYYRVLAPVLGFGPGAHWIGNLIGVLIIAIPLNFILSRWLISRSVT